MELTNNWKYGDRKIETFETRKKALVFTKFNKLYTIDMDACNLYMNTGIGPADYSLDSLKALDYAKM